MSGSEENANAEYIVVGSGAGGGTVAARLAESGRTVLLLEAGGDPRDASDQPAPVPESGGIPNDYDVPVFHGFASENDAMKWDFFVRHYKEDAASEAGSQLPGNVERQAGGRGSLSARRNAGWVHGA